MGTQLTFGCPEGFVFEHDVGLRPWFAIGCNERGYFGGPNPNMWNKWPEWPTCFNRRQTYMFLNNTCLSDKKCFLSAVSSTAVPGDIGNKTGLQEGDFESKYFHKIKCKSNHGNVKSSEKKISKIENPILKYTYILYLLKPCEMPQFFLLVMAFLQEWSDSYCCWSTYNLENQLISL